MGLLLNEQGSSDGYTLFGPMRFGTAYLIDNEGRLVHSWQTASGGAAPYLLEDGSLIRSVLGVVRSYAWDGTPIWTYDHVDGGRPHHDIEVLPNGNVLMIVRETKTAAEAIVEGRDPALLQEFELRPDFVIEVEPTGPATGNVVWEWHAWDHLVQDHNPAQNNFDVVADHPDLIDINFFDSARPVGGEADWHHTNAIDYNEELDQIVLSVRHFSELWVIDHSTTTEEAAGHTGGNSGKGGDLLYRWGNPQAYRAGGPADQEFFAQHDTRWIEAGMPGAGNLLAFNNGEGRPGPDFSSVDEIVPPVDGSGAYALTSGEAYGPGEPVWRYTAPNPSDFYSSFISGAVRLSSGNTLIDAGAQGTLFEVTPDGTTVWEYVSPVTEEGVLRQGDPVLPQSNLVFRAHAYAADYPGLEGRQLTPGGPIELAKPPPLKLLGDVNDDGVVESIDALLILQYDAAFLASLPNLGGGDVNDDGMVDSLDAALILQLTAGLLDVL